MFMETASGAKDLRRERNKILSLAQKRELDLSLVTDASCDIM